MNRLGKRSLSICFSCVCSLLFLSACGDSSPGSDRTSIHLSRSTSDEWAVTYQLPAKTAVLAFARNPDASRINRWTPKDDQIEIVLVDGNEVVRRKDGEAFDVAEFQLTPTYTHLPKDYAPFSRFSDGGMLFHSGRYFACPETCEDKEPEWKLSFADERSQTVIVGSELNDGKAEWTDSSSGTVVYVGNSIPQETSKAWVIIDPAFPPDVAAMLNHNLPRMADYFAEKFGDLPRKPNLFASYDAAHGGSSGSQGGTLPDQIFMHFFGDSIEKQSADPDFDLWLSWFFAHETAHMHQTLSDTKQAWVHEGAADAFAAIVLSGWSDRARQYVDARKESAYNSCREGLQSMVLESAAEDGNFQLYYWCGMILHLRLDEALRKSNPEVDGLFTIWNAYEAEIAKGFDNAGLTYRTVVADLVGEDMATWVEEFTTKPQPDFEPPIQ